VAFSAHFWIQLASEPHPAAQLEYAAAQSSAQPLELLAVALDATKVKPIPTAATIARLASTFFIIDPYSPFSENRNNSTFCNDEEI
jgi:hypothetical protein